MRRWCRSRPPTWSRATRVANILAHHRLQLTLPVRGVAHANRPLTHEWPRFALPSCTAPCAPPSRRASPPSHASRRRSTRTSSPPSVRLADLDERLLAERGGGHAERTRRTTRTSLSRSSQTSRARLGCRTRGRQSSARTSLRLFTGARTHRLQTMHWTRRSEVRVALVLRHRSGIRHAVLLLEDVVRTVVAVADVAEPTAPAMS